MTGIKLPPPIYWTYDPATGLVLPGVTTDRNGFKFQGGICLGIGNSSVNGGGFTDNPDLPGANIIIPKRGLAANLPTLLPAELAVALDTGDVWVGLPGGNQRIGNGNILNVTSGAATTFTRANNGTLYQIDAGGVSTVLTIGLVASLGNGWYCGVINKGNAVNSVATSGTDFFEDHTNTHPTSIPLNPGESVVVVSNGVDRFDVISDTRVFSPNTTSTVTTTDATPTVIQTIPLADNTSYPLTATFAAVNTGATGGVRGDTAGRVIALTFKRTGGGGAASVGFVTTLITNSDPGLGGVTVGFATSGNNVTPQVTGLVGTTIKWSVTTTQTSVAQ